MKKFNQERNELPNGTVFTGGIGYNVVGNYSALAPVFARFNQVFIERGEATDDYRDYYRYDASYMKLAHYAYNNSLGTANGSPLLKSNQEMANSPESYFAHKLADANFTYDELTVNKAKAVMRESLTAVAAATNTNAAVLRKVVDLALYNESMYGLHYVAENTDDRTM